MDAETIILLLLFFLMSPMLMAQGRQLEKAYQGIVEKGLARGVNIEQLISEKRINDYDTQFAGIIVVDSIIYNPHAIGRMQLEANWLPQRMWFITATIYIVNSIINEPDLLEVVLAHEIAHFLGHKHTCDYCTDIMAAYHNTNTESNIYKEPFSEERWDEFFKILRHEDK